MNDLLETILCIAAAAVICGLRYLSKNPHPGEERDAFRRWFLQGGRGADAFRGWSLSGRHAHDPSTPEIEREDEQRAHVAQVTASRSRKARAEPEHSGEPIHSRFEPPETTPRTPMYRGQPARLWWLPEQEVPKGRHHVMLGTAGESCRCRRCTESNPAGSTFCGQCGASLPAWYASTSKAAQWLDRRQAKTD